jgi:hypothetical protein
VKNLVKADRLVREKARATAMSDSEYLSLPPDGGQPEGSGNVVPIRGGGKDHARHELGRMRRK